MRRRLSLLLSLLLVLVTTAGASGAEAATWAPRLSVDGTRIVNANGQTVQLHGVNRAGSEYACAQGWGIFDGRVDDASLDAMATWKIRAVRIPLNSICWLGINGVNPAYGGQNYRSAIRGFVDRILAHGMTPILDLHWTAPGSEMALSQRKMPDADHVPQFWRQVATAYGKDQRVVFDLFNEPRDVSWKCVRDGCTVDGYQAVGMQRLVNVVREAGAVNLLLIAGNGWAGDLSQWARWRPRDPLRRIAASWHVYNFSACVTESCWQSQVSSGVAGTAPVVFTEFGQSDCATWFVRQLMTWADSRRIGYVAWTWDTWPNCDGPTLITSYSGTPTSYGAGVRDHFVARF